MRAVVIQGNHVTADTLFQHHRAAAGADVLFHQGMRRIHGDVTDVFSLGVIRHVQTVFIVRIQNGRITRHFNRNSLQLSQLLECIDSFQAQVIRSHVETGGNIAATVAQAGSQQAATRSLHHRHVNGWVTQYNVRRSGACHVALDGKTTVNVHPVSGSHANRMSRCFQDVGQHSGCGCLAIGPGDAGDRNTPGTTRWKQHIHDLAGNVTGFAFGWSHVHAKAWSGVNFDNGAPDLFE